MIENYCHSYILIPNYFLDEMLNELTPIMKKYAPKRIPVPDVLYEYFIMRSRANLHVVLCFSPVIAWSKIIPIVIFNIIFCFVEIG